jgi:hypothetical protein
VPPYAPEQTVYSYLTPEVQDVVRDVLHYDADSIVRTLTRNYDPGLDDFHEPVIDAFEDHLEVQAIDGLMDFPYRYVTNGSSEGLFHLLSQYINRYREQYDADPHVYVLEGEYQGFEAYANALMCGITALSEDEVWRREHPRGLFLVSNPSARDGNWLPGQIWNSILVKHDVIVDLAYVGMTLPRYIDLAHPSIIAVVASMSKPFGLYYFRTGFAWTRKPVDSLYGNKWFKNVPSLHVAKAVLDNVPAQDLVRKYRSKQVGHINVWTGMNGRYIHPSDVWLLAYEDNGPDAYVRANKRARYCLTPRFMEMENA